MTLNKKQSKRGVAIQSGVHVSRHIARPLSSRLERRLQKRGIKHRIVDAALVAFMAVVVIGGIVWLLRADPGRRVEFTAVVAPRDVISGGASTLSISYTNRSKKMLENVTLALASPDYFVLQGVDDPSFEPTTNTISIGTLAPGANGLVKIRGVMFGDVGGTQTFTSTLSYTFDKTRTGSRTQTYAFSPTRSALRIETALPNKLVSGQRLNGQVRLTNDGPVSFPEAAVHPVYPRDFRLTDVSVPRRSDDTWIVPELEPGESTTIAYEGALSLATGASAEFRFEPSFVFGGERFAQDTLFEAVETIQSPLSISLTTREITAQRHFPVTVSWSDQNNVQISDVLLTIDGAANAPQWQIDTPVFASSRKAVLIPALSSGVNPVAQFRPELQFTLDETGDDVRVLGDATHINLPTDATLGTFARYFSSAGDQLGRGPLPPRVGDTTMYWLFLNVSQTQNELRDAVVSATLPAGVEWTGQQSVTFGAPLSYEPSTRRVTWTLGTLEPTVKNGQTIAASLAIALTPNEAYRGTVPALLSNIELRGFDAWAEQDVRFVGNNITARIAEDTGVVR